MKIGVFDSGIGGLKIAKAIRAIGPDIELFYISDYAYSPYGNLSLDEITERSIACTEILIEKGVSHIVIACNTATAAAVEVLRERFRDLIFVGVEPDINFVNRLGIVESNCLVMTTPSTAITKKFSNLVAERDPNQRMTYISFPKLASLVEELYRTPDKNLVYQRIKNEIELQVGDKKFSHVVLGCTHYGLIDNFISKLLGAVMICPANAIVQRLIDLTNIKKTKNSQLDIHYLETTVNNWQSLDLESLEDNFK